MFPSVFLALVLLSESRADYPHSLQCAEAANEPDDKKVLVQATDIPGSYNVTYCARVNITKETQWNLTVGTLKISSNNCVFNDKNGYIRDTSHSQVSIPLTHWNLTVGSLKLSSSYCDFNVKSEFGRNTSHSQVSIPIEDRKNCSRVSDSSGFTVPIIFV